VERHIAAGDVFSDLVADQHMRRATRRDRDHCRNERVFGRREIRSSARGEFASLHLANQVAQPIRVSDAVAVSIRDDFSGRRLGADIARDA
jgi:hypothetical protein